MFGSGSITLTQLCMEEVTGDGGRRQGRRSSSFAPRAPFFTASAPKGGKQMANGDATELRGVLSSEAEPQRQTWTEPRRFLNLG